MEDIQAEFKLLREAFEKDDQRSGVNALFKLAEILVCDIRRIADALEEKKDDN